MKNITLVILAFFHSVAFAQSDFFPQQKIESFLLLKTPAMVDYVRSLDIELFKFETDGTSDTDKISEDFLAATPKMDMDAFKRFSDLFEGDNLGVYLSRHNVLNNVKKDTLLLSSEADLWTIAHELSHALIDRHRHEEGNQVSVSNLNQLMNANEDYEEAMGLYRQFGKFLSLDYAVRAFEAMKASTGILIELLYAYELEEVKIERALISIYESKKSSGLSKRAYETSLWYSKRSCQKAMDKALHAKEIIEYFESILDSQMKKQIDQKLQEHRARVSAQYGHIVKYCEKS